MGLTQRDRISLETYRNARVAMTLIREAVEDCAPPGSVAREDYLTPVLTAQAEALVRGIYAIAGWPHRTQRTQSSASDKILALGASPGVCLGGGLLTFAIPVANG